MAGASGAIIATAAQAQSYDEPRQYEQLPPVEGGSYGRSSPYNNGPDVRRDGTLASPRDSYPSDRARDTRQGRSNDAYQPDYSDRGGDYTRDTDGDKSGDAGGYSNPDEYTNRGPRRDDAPGERYEPYDGPVDGQAGGGGGPAESGYYSKGEIRSAGHQFFGSVSEGLASVIEYAFQKAGRPNGYILGEGGGGAFVAGLTYGEGRLYTRSFGNQKVYWQGPSVGYDFGAAGTKSMVLVYNLRDPSDIFHRFGGVEGSAYLVGGVSIQFQKHGDVVLAPIRSGVGLRLGANIGYLKYTRSPTWNPF